MQQRIGKYEILERVGRGGMGSVFRAYDPMLDRAVALKVISSESDATEELRTRFFREAQACARLNHPNIVTVYELGEAEGQLFIVMELLEGEELSRIIAGRKIVHLEDKLSLMLQISDGLEFAHQKGIVHRDVKPNNIVVLRNGQVKILDFGIAHIEGSGTGLTRAGVIMGTIRYMAPEQVRGRADQRADIFSLGAVYYELLAYRPAFAGEDPMEILEQLRTQDPPRLIDVDPAVPAELSALVERALQKDPARRYATLGEMRPDLDGVRRRLIETATQLQGGVQIRLGELRELQAVCTARVGAPLTEKPSLVLPEPVRLAALQAIDREVAVRIEHARDVLARAQALQPAFERGLEALGRGEYDSAVTEFERVIHDVPEHAPALESLAVARREMEAQRQRHEALVARLREAEEACEAGEYERCVGLLRQITDSGPSAHMPEGFVQLQRRAEGALAAQREKARLEAAQRVRGAAEELLARCDQAQSAAKAADAKRDAALFWNSAERRRAEGQTALSAEDYANAGKHFAEALSLYERAAVVAREARAAVAARHVEDLLGEGERLFREGRFADCVSRIEEIVRLAPGHAVAGELRARAEEGLRRAGETDLAVPSRSRDAESPRIPRRLDETADGIPETMLAEVPAPARGEASATVPAQAPFSPSDTITSRPRGDDSTTRSAAPAAVTDAVGITPPGAGAVPAVGPSGLRKARARMVVGIAVGLAVAAVVGGYFLWGGAPPAPTRQREAGDKAALAVAQAPVSGAPSENAPTGDTARASGGTPALAPPGAAKALIARARQVAGTDPREAESLLRQALEADPNAVQASFQLGLIYARQKEYAKAIEAYGKAAELDPKFPDTLFNLAHVYAVTNEYQKAAGMYARVVALEPSYLDEALYNLAIVQEKQGKRPDAIQNLERAMRVNPDNKLAEKFLSSLKRKG
jgi:tetratricopeptide (TPR) repeat protein